MESLFQANLCIQGSSRITLFMQKEGKKVSKLSTSLRVSMRTDARKMVFLSGLQMMENISITVILTNKISFTEKVCKNIYRKSEFTIRALQRRFRERKEARLRRFLRHKRSKIPRSIHKR